MFWRLILILFISATVGSPIYGEKTSDLFPLTVTGGGVSISDAWKAEPEISAATGGIKVDLVKIHDRGLTTIINPGKLDLTESETFGLGETLISGTVDFENDESINFKGRLEAGEDGNIELEYSVRGMPIDNLRLRFRFDSNFPGRSFSYDGHDVVIPTTDSVGNKVWFRGANGVQTVRIPLLDGVLVIEDEGTPLSLSLDVQKDGTASLLFKMVKSAKSNLDGDLSLNLRIEPYEQSPLDIRRESNMGFSDAVADDGIGGWTDQGPSGDLSMLPVGQRFFGNVKFDVIAPQTNDGKSCMMFANSQRSYFLDTVDIKVNDGEHYRWLYLLNASAWTPREAGVPVGSVTVHYANGTSEKVDIRSGYDVGNWWIPKDQSNAAVVWQEVNSVKVPVGLYLSRIALKPVRIDSITLETADSAVWGVIGMTAVKEANIPPMPVEPANSKKFTTQEDADWVKFTYAKDVVAGSALDFSSLQDAPAGKYGRVVVHDGHFVFANRPEQGVRFNGTNIHSRIITQISHAQAEQLAQRVAALGYNAVRLHLYDKYLVSEGDSSSVLDPVALDNMDYLIYCLKQQGIYIVTDIFGNLTHGFSGRKFNHHLEVKFSAPFLSDVRQALKDYSRALLTHVNPYTGMALKDDPVLVSISLINEDALHTHYTVRELTKSADLQKAFEDSFKQWCKNEGKEYPDMPFSDQKLLTTFLVDKQREIYEDLATYVRSLGVEAPLSDLNHRQLYVQTLVRDDFDFVEMHSYHDHPVHTGEMFVSNPTYSFQDALTVLPDVFLFATTRIFGKPFMLTEWNFCYPNPYRSESGAVMGAYAALQNWDGIFRFNYASLPLTAFQNTHTWSFNTANDPMQLLSDRIAALLYLRGDVETAESKISFAVTPSILEEDFASNYMTFSLREDAMYPKDFSALATYCQIGTNVVTEDVHSLPVNATLSFTDLKAREGGWDGTYISADGDFLLGLEVDGVISAADVNPDISMFTSETGQIFVDGEQHSFMVLTPRSEVLIQEGKEQSGDALKVTDNSGFCTIFAGSLDGQNLPDSDRILVLHLTDIRNRGAIFTQEGDRIIIDSENQGRYPLLLRRGTAQVSLKLNEREGEPTVWALRTTGARIAKVPFTYDDGWLKFKVATDQGDYQTMAYEIEW